MLALTFGNSSRTAPLSKLGSEKLLRIIYVRAVDWGCKLAFEKIKFMNSLEKSADFMRSCHWLLKTEGNYLITVYMNKHT